MEINKYFVIYSNKDIIIEGFGGEIYLGEGANIETFDTEKEKMISS